jgi:hypothetical protein
MRRRKNVTKPPEQSQLARNKAPQPRTKANIQKTFHHDLTGERSGQVEF